MRFPLISGNPSSLWDSPSTDTSFPKRLQSLHSRRCTKTVWTWFCTSGCSCPCLSGVGVDQMTSRGAFQHQPFCDLPSFYTTVEAVLAPSYTDSKTVKVFPSGTIQCCIETLGWLRNSIVHLAGLTSPHFLVSKVVQLNTCFWIYSLVLYIPGNCSVYLQSCGSLFPAVQVLINLPTLEMLVRRSFGFL